MFFRLLRDILNIFVFMYLDDILIFSLSLKVHVQYIHCVTASPRRLFVKTEKCAFHARPVMLLGFVSADGINMDPAKSMCCP